MSTLHQRIAGIVVGAALASICLMLQAKSPTILGGSSRKPAPAFELTDSSGALVKLSDFKGRVVLLNFWATWCHGCQTEIPWFIEFENKYKRDGLTVIGVSMDDDGWKSVKPWIGEKKVNYPVVIGGESLGKKFGLGAMPKTLLIDRDGKVAFTHEGVVDRGACEKELRSLLRGVSKLARN